MKEGEERKEGEKGMSKKDEGRSQGPGAREGRKERGGRGKEEYGRRKKDEGVKLSSQHTHTQEEGIDSNAAQHESLISYCVSVCLSSSFLVVEDNIHLFAHSLAP